MPPEAPQYPSAGPQTGSAPMQPPDSSAQAPADPQSMMGPSTMGNEPMPPDVLDNLRGRMAGAESQFEQLDTQHKLSMKQIEDLKHELLADVFQSLKEIGVNPGDQASVQEFLNTLEQESPDLARLFEFFFNVLSPADLGGSPQGTDLPAPSPSPDMANNPDSSATDLANSLAPPGADTETSPESAPEDAKEPNETEGMPMGSFLGETPQAK